MKFIKNIKDLTTQDFLSVGAKAANLSKMSKVGFSVSPAFVINAAAFFEFLKFNKLDKKIESALAKFSEKDLPAIEEFSQIISQEIIKSSLSINLQKEIESSFKILGAKYVAVRSSSSSEDSKGSAWAGQLDTFLQVKKSDLILNIKKTWASLFSVRAIFYRLANKQGKRKISVSVIIQKMVESEVAGIAFSLNPVNSNNLEILIEAAYGLGEAIVSGQVTPDRYFLVKKPLLLLEKEIVCQKKYLKAGTLNTWKKVANKMSDKSKLSEEQIFELAALVLRLESFFSYPIDVEWALEKGKFYIMQSRPITVLTKVKKKNLYSYIESQKWFWGIRPEKNLLLYSARGKSYRNFLQKDYGLEFTETFLLPLKRNLPVRTFNLWQTKVFHALSQDKLYKNPRLILDYIKKSYDSYKQLELLRKKICQKIDSDKYSLVRILLLKILKEYELVNALFIINFSLGMKLEENKKQLRNSKSLLAAHDKWRNTVAFYDEELLTDLFIAIEYLFSKSNLILEPKQLIYYLTKNEFQKFLQDKLSLIKIKNIIKKRQKNSFIYLGFRNYPKEIIDEAKLVKKIKKHFLKKEKSLLAKDGDLLKGQVVYKSSKIIKGKAILVKDKRSLVKKSHLLKNKILLASQTTPHYIPYLQTVKAIVTEEGGLTCHAAILAREFKIPCLVGVRNVTKFFKDNDDVKIDMENGRIYKIKK